MDKACSGDQASSLLMREAPSPLVQGAGEDEHEQRRRREGRLLVEGDLVVGQVGEGEWPRRPTWVSKNNEGIREGGKRGVAKICAKYPQYTS